MIYHRLTVYNNLRYLIVVLPIVFGVGGLSFFSKLLSYTVTQAIPLPFLGKMLLLTLLKYMPQLLILSIFTSIFLTIRQSFQRNEMDAWFSAGIGIRHFIIPILLFALPAACLVGAFSLYWSAWSTQHLNILRNHARFSLETNSIPRNQFGSIPGGSHVYFWDDQGNIFIARNDKQHREIILTQRIESKENNLLELINGSLFRLQEENHTNALEKMTFDSMLLSLPSPDNSNLSARSKQPNALIWSIPAERAELIWRLSLPIAVIVLALVALLLASSHPRLGGMRYSAPIAIVVLSLYLNLLRYVEGQVEDERWSAISALLLPPTIVGLLILLVLYSIRRQ